MLKEIGQADYASLLRGSLATIKKLKAELAQQKNVQEPIAIIGMGCRFPGGCHDPETFWQFLVDGGDGVVEFPRDRFNLEALYDPDPNASGKMYLREGGFLQENVGDFDARFFGISPREAVEMDPQQRMLLEVSWQALERAGIPPKQLKGTQTGVFIGIIGSEYALLPREESTVNPYRLTGTIANIASGRISYILGVHGPSISLDTACSSSLVAVHLACESLRRGESSLALAGGVSLMIAPSGFLSLCALHVLAKDGRCKTFDVSGDGYGRGEGCGIVVLKRLSDALRDNDAILAVIKGTGVNQDGPGSGLTVPNGVAQQALIRKVLEETNLSPTDIGYMEVHGTGTSVGDPIEFQALTEVFGKDSKREQPLYIGSVKSNIGHLEAAAGVASLIKSVLCLQHEQIPPNLHLHTLNPKIRLQNIPAEIPQKVIPWNTTRNERMLGLSAFGFSGTNAHVIVSEWKDALLASAPTTCTRPWHILALSAKDDKTLSQVILKYKKHFDQINEEQLEDICFTAAAGRSHFARRIAFIAENQEQMKHRLAEYLRGDNSEDVIAGKGRDHTHPKLAILIDGKITPALAQSLFETQPTFQTTLRACNAQLQQLVHISLLESGPSGERIRAGISAGLLDELLAFAVHLSMLKLWETWGVRPNAVLGSASGELVAAHAAGIMSIETALCFILERWGMAGTAANQPTLQAPQIRVVAGRTGKLVEKQEALSPQYWNSLVSGELDRKKGIQSLQRLGYTHFLQTGIIEDAGAQADLLTSFNIEYFPSVTEVDPWRTLTKTLANLYCLGLDIDWSGFEQGYNRRKVIVPTYPFQRSHFWNEDTVDHRAPQQPQVENKLEARPAANPLDGQITHSPIKTKQIEYCLSLDALPDVQATRGVLLVGYFLELLARAVKNLYHTTAFVLQIIEFFTVLIIPESGAITLSLTLDAKKSDELDFAFFSHQGGENWHKHAQGTILLDNTGLTAGTYARPAIMSRCTDQYSGAQFYQQVEERGLFLGESVQWIEEIWSREGEALARMRSPRSLKISKEYEMGFHPGVFEACAQLFHAALSRSENTDMRYMVTRWEDFAYTKPRSLDQVFWCHVVLQEGSQIGNQLQGRFSLFDENGTLLAQIRSGVMRGLNKERESILRNFLVQSETAKERKSDSPILRALSGLSRDQWQDCLNDYLQQLFAATLHVEVQDLNKEDALLDMGMDSIVGMEAKTKLEEELGVVLPIELLISGPSISELSGSILPLLEINPASIEHETKEVPLPTYKTDMDAWIVHRKSNPHAKVKLFCFSYGGSKGASLYRTWQSLLPDAVEVCPVQLPGKGNRIKERAFTDIGRATEVLKEVLVAELDRPYAFYGHSSGALLAYRLAYKLWREIDNKPKHLFVGAYSSPTILPNPVLSLTREKFKARGYNEIPDPESLSSITPQEREQFLGALHAVSPELQTVWESPEWQQLLLPTALAELHMVKSHTMQDALTFNIPITAFHGEMDEKVDEPEMHAWQDVTQGTFTLHTLPGGHLFLHEDQDQKRLLELISHHLERYYR